MASSMTMLTLLCINDTMTTTGKQVERRKYIFGYKQSHFHLLFSSLIYLNISEIAIPIIGNMSKRSKNYMFTHKYHYSTQETFHRDLLGIPKHSLDHS